MSLSRLSTWITHLLALTAFGTLTLSRALPMPLLLIGVLGVLAGLGLKLQGIDIPIPRRLWNALTVLFFLFFIVDTLWISQSPLEGGVHFLIYLMLQKLFTLKKAKDDLQLHLIAFFQLLAAADRTSDISFGLAFVFFMMLTTWSLIFYQFRKEEEVKGRLILRESVKEVITPPFFFWTNTLSAITLLTTLLIFLFIPRIGTGYLQSRMNQPQAMAGFSERVKLGSIGPIKLDPTVTMRVELPQYRKEPAFPLYFRGMTFDYYASGTWENTYPAATPLERTGFRFHLPQGPFLTPSRQGTLLQQKISLEPIASTVLFAASQPLFVEGAITQVSADETGVFHLPQPPRERISYQAVSLIKPLAPEDRRLSTISYPESIQTHYLQVEENPRLEALARQITENYDTVFEKIIAVQNFLTKNYRYTLDVPPSRGEHPIEEFLFENKEGYCEHYASAMVLLLRQVGIAARMVSGFLSGEWNPFGKYLVVRQQDAHTWVEVYFSENGWTLFDPTPATPGRGSIALFSSYMDWMKTRWDRYVIHYSILDQVSLMRDGWNWLSTEFPNRSSLSWNSSALRKIPQWGIALVVVGIGILLVRNVLWSTHRSGSLFGPREPQSTRTYLRLLKLLAKQGWKKKKEETPKEFAQRIEPNGPLKKKVYKMTILYNRLRFSEDRENALMLEELQSLLEDLGTETIQPYVVPSTRSKPDRVKREQKLQPNGDEPSGWGHAKDRREPRRPARPR